MSEVWLKTNRRALVLGLIVPGLMLLASLSGLAWSIMAGWHWVWQLPLALLSVVPLWMIGELLYAASRPRLGYEGGELLVYLEPAKATKVPIDIVEVFFLGQGPSELPKIAGREPETQNIVVRLAESAVDWKHRDVKPALGHWCESYITIRGSWCEPITPEVMKNLNRRLIEVQRERGAEKASGKEGEGAKSG
jgi:hypothetical protein